MHWLVSSLLALPVFCAASAATPATFYFPADLNLAGLSCARDPASVDRLRAFRSGWYSRHLAAAGEPSLYRLSLRQRARRDRSLRFLWLRSFDAPVVVRVEWRGDRPVRLVAKQLSGQGGYEPGKVDRTVVRDLDQASVVRIETASAANRLFQVPERNCGAVMLDGAEWVFEAVDSGGYHFTEQQSPRNGAARDVGELLLGLTGWSFDHRY